MEFPKAKSPFPGCPAVPQCPSDFIMILLSLGKASIGSPLWLWFLFKDLQSVYPKDGQSILFSTFFSKNANNLRIKLVPILPADCPSLSLSSL